MGATFRCWLIANFELVMYILVLIVTAILLFGVSDSEDAFKVFAYSALFAGMLSFPTNKGVFQFGKYLFLVGMGVVATIGVISNPEPEYAMLAYFLTVFTIASVLSLLIAVYTYINIDEVLSRRMLYWNSNVALFEFSWLYTLDRFCNISLSIVVCTFWLWFTIAFTWAA